MATISQLEEFNKIINGYVLLSLFGSEVASAMVRGEGKLLKDDFSSYPSGSVFVWKCKYGNW